MTTVVKFFFLELEKKTGTVNLYNLSKVSMELGFSARHLISRELTELGKQVWVTWAQFIEALFKYGEGPTAERLKRHSLPPEPFELPKVTKSDSEDQSDDPRIKRLEERRRQRASIVKESTPITKNTEEINKNQQSETTTTTTTTIATITKTVTTTATTKIELPIVENHVVTKEDHKLPEIVETKEIQSIPKRPDSNNANQNKPSTIARRIATFQKQVTLNDIQHAKVLKDSAKRLPVFNPRRLVRSPTSGDIPATSNSNEPTDKEPAPPPGFLKNSKRSSDVKPISKETHAPKDNNTIPVRQKTSRPASITRSISRILASKCNVEGLKVIKRMTLGQEAQLVIEAKDIEGQEIRTGGEQFHCVAIGKNKTEPVEITDNKNGTYSINWKPTEPGEYKISVTYDSSKQPVAGSPFLCIVKAPAISSSLARSIQCSLEGQGLKHGIVKRRSKFTVNVENSEGTPIDLPVEELSFKILQPDRSPLPFEVRGNNGRYSVSYTPIIPGDHQLDVLLYENSVLPKPLIIPIQLGTDPSKCIVEGPGLKPIKVGEPAIFTIATFDQSGHARSSGGDHFTIKIFAPDNSLLDYQFRDKKNGQYVVQYFPSKAGKHAIHILMGDVPVAASPYYVNCTNASIRFKFDGIGLKGGICDNLVTFFIKVESDEGKLINLGSYAFEVKIFDPDNQEVKGKVMGGDGSYMVEYLPKKLGVYTIDVLVYGNSILQGKLLRSLVGYGPDVSKCVALGEGLRIAHVGKSSKFEIYSKDRTGKVRSMGGDLFTVSIQAPDGTHLSSTIQDKNNGTYLAEYVPCVKGRHQITINLGVDKVCSYTVNVT
eukprot:TRINITY_DN11194_c0_g1_i1.p1 TRINITY_DN11194_c0_g1~~TRINITY_DN11194_c0_g1_i1.p1  ORF type:complete len:828 (-),score=154.77 TRINITY_DN11194_c0_g1_i1:52-2535(-)